MRAITRFLAGGTAIAALAGAAPAAAQYFPGMGFPGYGYGMPGYGYGQFGYGVNRQAAIGQCSNAVQARLNGGYNYGYGYGTPYGGGGRVLGVSHVDPRGDGGMVVRGVASSGRYGAYGYNGQGQIDLVWRCRTDFRGFVVDVDVDPAQRNYGYNYNYNYAPQPANPYDYSQYGYQRY